MRKNISGLFALALVGGIYIYKNRVALQKYLESLGIPVPELLHRSTKKFSERVEQAKQSIQSVQTP